MIHQHHLPADEPQHGAASSETQPVGAPRRLYLTVGKHFSLSVSLSVSPAFLVCVATAVGIAGGNYWFLL
ncbi:hypothetical protein [Streptomyces griseus]|uniref:hypothetical protein n=1 Tax=Streptomyces griseus TaxID=1911 RepID=UPI00380781B2